MNPAKFAFCLFLLTLPPAARAVELKISAQALEHTLKERLFNAPD